MYRNEYVKVFLGFIFIIILISGTVITILNYQRWDSINTSVVREFRNKIVLQKAENADINEDAVISTKDDLNVLNAVSENTGDDLSGKENILGDDHSTDDISRTTQADTTQDRQDNITQENTNKNGILKVGNMEDFYISSITDEIFSRINGKTYREGCPVSLDELRYVHIRHYGFEGELCTGELIVNAAIAEDVLEIFEELYAIKYPIEKMRLVDEYDADDERSMEDNNSSCFNYRTIAESTTLSNHAYGRAIDINPFYNPYVYYREDGSLFLQPKGSEKYIDRDLDAACIIKQGDECYNIFIAHGFKWGGNWNPTKDYQHFEKLD